MTIEKLKEKMNADEQTVAMTSRQQRAKSSQQPVILYDGKCGLCINSVKWIKRFDWLHKFSCRDVSAGDELLRDFPGIDIARALQEMHVIMPNGRQLTGFFAFREISRNLPLGWLIWPLLFIPGVPFFGVRMYRFIARHRSRRDVAVCAVHWGK